MIFLTADVHNRSFSPGTGDKTEAELALQYAETARKNKVKTTFFVSGKTFLEEPVVMKTLSEMPNVEIGGHTWNCFRPLWIHVFFDVFLRTHYGPCFYQKKDIEKTIRIIEKTTGKKCVSWRTHGFLSDRRTMKILKKKGIKVVSDAVNPESAIEKISSGFVSLPVNTYPDYGHLYARQKDLHNRNPLKEFAKKVFYIDLKRDGFPEKMLSTEQWLNYVKKKTEKPGQKFVTILAHPLHMKLVDDMKTFEKLCKFLKNKKTCFVSEAN